jgi:hypothetical protein
VKFGVSTVGHLRKIDRMPHDVVVIRSKAQVGGSILGKMNILRYWQRRPKQGTCYVALDD